MLPDLTASIASIQEVTDGRIAHRAAAILDSGEFRYKFLK
jgi:hypothetical protein